MLKLTAALKFFFVLFGLMLCRHVAISQVPAPPALQQKPADTLREVEIIEGRSLRKLVVDSLNRYQTIAGNVKMREGLTTFTCDSASIHEITKVMEAYGNIHINQHDSIHTYSQYLKYIGTERIAYLKKDVRLTDKKGTLYTQELEYDLKTNIGKYFNGGRVNNGKTTLTSEEGVYYADTHDVYFKKKVHLADPKYDIDSDSLLYNTQTQVVTFITATHIKSKESADRDIYTSSGTYDLKNGKAFFGFRTIFIDSTRKFVSDNSAINEKENTAQLEGNAVIIDSVNGYTVLGGQIFINTKQNTFLATRKPVLIFKGEGNDSTFVAADTLFSGLTIIDKNGNKVDVKTDTLKTTTIVTDSTIKTARNDQVIRQDTAVKFADDDAPVVVKVNPPKAVVHPPAKKDSTLKTVQNDRVIKQDTAAKFADDDASAIAKVNLPKAVFHPPAKKDSTIAKDIAVATKDTALVKMDSAALTVNDSLAQAGNADFDSSFNRSIGSRLLKKDTSINIANDTALNNPKDSAIRYFLAFHHVRIFNDSLQSVCDSLYYSSKDSVFRLYRDPLVFSSKSQISGDTINLYTKNKKVDRVHVFDNGLLINEIKPNMYNQMGGRTMNGYFKEGALDYMRVKGSPAESIFFPQDKDSGYTGMNRAKGDVIDIYFVNKEVNKVKFINDVDGVLYPIKQIPSDQKYLAKFKWWEARRPKSKWELFE